MRAGFILSEVWSGLRKNVSMVLSVVLVTFVSLLFVGAAILLQMQVGQMKDYWYDRVQVSVFLCPPDSEATNCVEGEATDTQKKNIEDQLESSELAPMSTRSTSRTKARHSSTSKTSSRAPASKAPFPKTR